MRITLKRPCYALQDPVTGQFFRLSGPKTTIRPALLSTLFASRDRAISTGSDRLQGIPHELVRLDPKEPS